MGQKGPKRSTMQFHKMGILECYAGINLLKLYMEPSKLYNSTYIIGNLIIEIGASEK